MENNLLYCYKEWLEEEEGTLFKQIFKMPVKFRVLLASLIAVFIAFLVFGFLSDTNKSLNVVVVVLAVVYIVLCITVSICTERHQIKNSGHDLESYKEYCMNLKKGVISKYKIPLKTIPELINRLNAMSDKIEKKIEHKHEQFNKFMEMLLIPISAVILGALLDKKIDVNEVLDFGLSGTVIIMAIYGLILLVLLVIDLIMRAPQGRYRRFATDLQSVLDFGLCENDTESCDSASNTASAETAPEDEEPQTLPIQ